MRRISRNLSGRRCHGNRFNLGGESTNQAGDYIRIAKTGRA
jgi:hypothetical protein